jgi:hypothetical protein
LLEKASSRVLAGMAPRITSSTYERIWAVGSVSLYLNYESQKEAALSSRTIRAFDAELPGILDAFWDDGVLDRNNHVHEHVILRLENSTLTIQKKSELNTKVQTFVSQRTSSCCNFSDRRPPRVCTQGIRQCGPAPATS